MSFRDYLLKLLEPTPLSESSSGTIRYSFHSTVGDPNSLKHKRVTVVGDTLTLRATAEVAGTNRGETIGLVLNIHVKEITRSRVPEVVHEVWGVVHEVWGHWEFPDGVAVLDWGKPGLVVYEED